jgi:CBS domain-containing protein
MPVYDKENKFIVGRISSWDIANFFANEPNFSLSKRICDMWPQTIGVTEEDLKSYKFGPGGLESVHTFPADTELPKLLESFAQGIHRVLVTYKVEGRENILQNISQSDVFRFLYTEPDALHKKFLHMSLNDLNCIVRPALTMEGDTTVFDAIRKMVKENVTAVAITDPEKDNKVFTTFSASDLRNIDANILKNLDKISLKKYLQDTRIRLRRPITINGTNTVEDALKRMVLSHIHRLWEVDENNHVTGVFSMTDFFKSVVRQPVE